MAEHKNEFIDITAENFVLAYVDEFNPKIIEWYPYGSLNLQNYIKKIRFVDTDIIVNFGKMDI